MEPNKEAVEPQTPNVEPNKEKEEPKRTKDNKFKLGEVTVVITATMEPVETVNTKIDAEEIQEMNRDTVGTAVALLPGVSTTVNSRNEQMIYVRGNDSRQVPLFIDGIPSYVPYDGSMDYARFTTFDLSEIQVAKGFSSVTYGANTLGGAINLVTRKPANAFEGDIRLGAFDGEGQKVALNAGTNQGRWYMQAGGSYSKADDWRMSSNFTPNSREDGHTRDNSDFIDKRYSLKVGFTPNDQNEYAVGVTQQWGSKGQPVSTDTTSTARYWIWPTWDKNSYFFSSNTAIGDKSYVKAIAYFDTYKNTINSYTNATYTTLAKTGSISVGPLGESLYDDFTHGVRIEAGTLLLPRQSLKATLQTKTDVHREDDGTHASTAQWKNYEDQYFIWGVEDTISLPADVDLSLGLGEDNLKPVHSGPTWALPDSKNYFHSQAGIFWRATPKIQLYATFAQKDHFPTLKDRYSQRFATFIENPDLQPERSVNMEIGAKTSPVEWLELDGALFQSDIRNLIQEKKNVSGTKSQMQNIGKVQNSGVEVSADFKPSQVFRSGVGYTYLNRTNQSDPSTRLTGTPRTRATGYLRWEPVPVFYVLTALQTQDYLWDSNTVRLGGFTTVDLTLGWKPKPQLLIDGGFTNLLDRNYQLASGYPLPGRMWFVNGRYKF